MKRSHAAIGAGALIVGFALFLWFRSTLPSRTSAPPAQVKSGAAESLSGSEPNGAAAGDGFGGTGMSLPLPSALPGQPAQSPPRRSDLITEARSALADRLGAADTPVGDEPKVVLQVLDAYRRTIGAYPAGEGNREIVNALLGANSQKLPFLPDDHPRLNAQGELVDHWARPFYFHQISRDSIEVRSAGADGALFTEDDSIAGAVSKNAVREELHL